MMFPFFNNRRKQILAEPFPTNWDAYLDNNVRLSRALSVDDKARLRDITKVLVREKNWEGCNGLALTDEITVTIAGHAALLILAINNNYYPNVESILIYPGSYKAVEHVRKPGMVVSEVAVGRLGEAWSGDWPIVLSWPDVLAGGRDESDGRNVVLHEFAHKLDFGEGGGDGVPPLHSRADYDRWSEVMSREFQNLTYLASTGRPSLLDKYGATNPAEFFAVITECFFERPHDLHNHHPDLYTIFSRFYLQDPAGRT